MYPLSVTGIGQPPFKSSQDTSLLELFLCHLTAINARTILQRSTLVIVFLPTFRLSVISLTHEGGCPTREREGRLVGWIRGKGE